MYKYNFVFPLAAHFYGIHDLFLVVLVTRIFSECPHLRPLSYKCCYIIFVYIHSGYRL